MTLNKRQIALLESMAASGVTSPVTRQDIVNACEATGAYACPPSWLTQDSARKVGRGLYDCPELAQFTGASPVAESPSTESPAPVAAPAPAVQGAVETVDTSANLVMGMTGGERASLVPDRFRG